MRVGHSYCKLAFAYTLHSTHTLTGVRTGTIGSTTGGSGGGGGGGGGGRLPSLAPEVTTGGTTGRAPDTTTGGAAGRAPETATGGAGLLGRGAKPGTAAGGGGDDGGGLEGGGRTCGVDRHQICWRHPVMPVSACSHVQDASVTRSTE